MDTEAITGTKVDRAASPRLFILTGSAVPSDDVSRHSGAGRFLRLRQRTMAWSEREGSTPPIGLRALFDNAAATAGGDAPTYDQVIDTLTVPGFPAMVALPRSRQRALLEAYLSEIGRTDIHRIAEVRHSPALIDRLLQAIARSSASEVSYRTLTSDLRTIAPAIKPDTVAGYVDLLTRLFIVERQTAWTPAIRSRARLRTSDKLHLADPALAAVALNASPEQLKADPNTAGLLFESAVFHDLSVFMTALGGTVHHYRDSNGHEIDLILRLAGGTWAAVEVKLGGNQVPAAAKSLSRAIEQIDTAVTGPPRFRLIVTGTGATYTLDDGTITAPLSAIGP